VTANHPNIGIAATPKTSFVSNIPYAKFRNIVVLILRIFWQHQIFKRLFQIKAVDISIHLILPDIRRQSPVT
jgi:hypothetical protein